MAKLVSIPEASLEQLLREAGRSESVEAYLASTEVQASLQTGQRLVKRARAAYWSRFWLCSSAVISWAFFLGDPGFENFISGVLLTGMTVVEFKVYRFFMAADVRGAIYGWWNQCLFALLFLIYGTYHGTFVDVPATVRDQVAVLGPDMMDSLISTTRLFYYTVAIVGSVGQFWLACYYRAARK